MKYAINVSVSIYPMPHGDMDYTDMREIQSDTRHIELREFYPWETVLNKIVRDIQDEMEAVRDSAIQSIRANSG